MAEENIQKWGPFGELALKWCQAFMDDNDYTVLMIYLQKRMWIMKDSDLQAVIQQYERMTQPEMRLAAMNLQSVGIMKLDETKSNTFQRDNHFKTMQINPEFVHCLERQWKILDEKCKCEKVDMLKQEKSFTLKYCSICKQTYPISDYFLKNLRKCEKYNCAGELINSEIDEQKKKNILVLEKILEKIKESIYICRGEVMPTKEEIEQSQQMIQEIETKQFIDNDVEKHWQEQQKTQIEKIFKMPIRKQINEYIQRKKNILQKRMNIE